MAGCAPAGMRYALLQAAPHARIVGAFEISDLANDVYEHNHGWRPWQGNIETVRCCTGFRNGLLSDTRVPPHKLRQRSLCRMCDAAYERIMYCADAT